MNLYDNKKRIIFYTQRPGAALILTMVVLVLLTALIYRLSSSVSQWKHRMQYMIDYQTARYACESGLKYALATISEVDPNYVSRPNEPDFSDLFTMSDEAYRLMMTEWAQKLAVEVDANNLNKNDFLAQFMNLSSLWTDANSRTTDFNSLLGEDSADICDVNVFYVRGPYGPPWPYVTEPIEIEFGDAHLVIEIIDENAKLPIVWGICADANSKSESKAAVVTFCEWMQMEPNDIEPLMDELEQIEKIKPFSANLKPIVTTTKVEISSEQDDKNASASRRARLRRSRRARQRRAARRKTVQQTRPDISHTMDFAKILHSPMVNLETLARPVNEDQNRTESALKYISLWGADKVNINTAPRHVLESAFTFGGDSVEIAEQIITLRKEEPFKNIDDLARRLYSYNASIDKAKRYITAESDCFSIRVKATSGVATVCATAGLKKEKGKFEQIGIIVE
ncbi:MAG: general secretion pathway protein GspK [Planctomycetes bacterium]|nr:general secretion pathway protein GspK [Planctomycetota bacterium]MBU1518163.1 general secretion pathway protein GspK [Planctomycetota bacterium]MBU2457100.1 general secretion pathway protein GspK [Planctomycetota bacterium]MBU2597435.1 general secretion pathway protein GspK [Planctomycetota bacterium]